MYGEIGCPFADVEALGQSEGVSFLRVRPGFDSCFNLEVRFLTFINSPKIITKITNIISEMDRVPTAPNGAYVKTDCDLYLGGRGRRASVPLAS